MLLEFYLLFWITCIIFTVMAFAYRGELFFPLICFLLWNGLAIFGTNIDWVGMGSINFTSYSQGMGDPGWEWMIGLNYVFHGLGIAMLVFGVYDTFIVARTAVVELDESMQTGKPYQMFPKYR